jgi:hypothetical protein
LTSERSGLDENANYLRAADRGFAAVGHLLRETNLRETNLIVTVPQQLVDRCAGSFDLASTAYQSNCRPASQKRTCPFTNSYDFSCGQFPAGDRRRGPASTD